MTQEKRYSSYSRKKRLVNFVRNVVVIEKSATSFGADGPDSGCVAEAEKEVRKLIPQAIELHLEDLQDSSVSTPKPLSKSEYVEVFETWFG